MNETVVKKQNEELKEQDESSVEISLKNKVYMTDVVNEYHGLVSDLVSDPSSLVDWIKTKDLVYMLGTINLDVRRLQLAVGVMNEDYHPDIELALGDIGLTLACMKKRLEIERRQLIDHYIDVLANDMKVYVHDMEGEEGILSYNTDNICQTMLKEVDTIRSGSEEPAYYMDLLITAFAGWRKSIFAKSERLTKENKKNQKKGDE